jgi:hypothetical protein
VKASSISWRLSLLQQNQNNKMEPKTQPFETKGHDLTGAASLEFNEKESMKSFISMIPGMDIDQFDPVALKIFLSGETPMITLYAIDKVTIPKNNYPEDKLPVRKFKAPVSLKELFRFVKSFDLVVHEGNFDIDNMWVENR